MNIFIFYNSFLITLIAIIVIITSFSITNKGTSISKKYKNVIRLQQGMTFKFQKKNGKYIHTLCDGKLLYRLGISPKQVIGQELHHFLPSDMALKKERYYSMAWEGAEDITYEGQINSITYLATLSPIKRNGKVIEVIASCIEITDRKTVERALRESEEKYRLIAENMTDLIAVMDEDGIVTYASPSHKTILGLNPTEYESKSPFSYIHPEDRPHVQKVFQECVRTKEPSQAEFRFLHTNGNWIYLESKAMPVTVESGKMHGVVVTTRDITERKLTEEYLRKSDRLTVVGQLAAGVAHEIRNPLTSLKGFLQLLKPVIVEKKFYEIMNSELDRIESIIREYLVLAKPQMVKIETKDINSIMEHVIALAQTEANMNNIEIRYEIETGLPLIRCEENQLKQVFINILKNGIEAMPNGGIITIILKRKDDGQLLIRFIDEGNGIPEEILCKLGEPFYTTKDKGTGLGLMVSYKIIENHNGTIKIASEINKGTTIDIVLPIGSEL